MEVLFYRKISKSISSSFIALSCLKDSKNTKGLNTELYRCVYY